MGILLTQEYGNAYISRRSQLFVNNPDHFDFVYLVILVG